MTYKIGSFNCLKLGQNSNKDFDAFYKIITKEKFDIIALQEISNAKALDLLLRHLPGGKWKGTCDYFVGDYAFIWNSERVCLAKNEDSSNNVSRIYQPRIYKQYKVDKLAGQKDLKRDPYFARFYPIGGGAPFIEIRIINCHVRFSGDDEGNSLNLSAVNQRKNEIEVLTKAIYAKESDKRYGTNRPAYTILLGDYNLNLPASGKYPILNEIFEINENGNVKRIKTMQSQLTTIKSKLDEETQFSNNYDHFTYDELRFEDTNVECSRVNAVEKYYDGDYEKYRKNVSDHVPVMLELNLRKG